MPRSNKTVPLYNLFWQPSIPPVQRELIMIRKGGQWTKADGEIAGKGLLFHWLRAAQLIWPEIYWHRWNILFAEKYLEAKSLGVLGPASSGKTHCAAMCGLLDYYAFPDETTIMMCSTTYERLEDRIWGEAKRLHKMARERCYQIPGYLIESRRRLLTDLRKDGEGRDFRNGIIGVPCKKGGEYVGMGELVGLKNKRVRLIGDELQFLPKVFVDAISNLDKNPDFKVVGMGNPKDTLDALGILCEPAPELGGWESGIDQGPKTKTWKTKREGGICIQFVGSDSPNLDGKMPIPLITQAQIDRDVSMFGKDSLQFTQMDEGRMPRGQGSRRVITRQLCVKNRAMDEPHWRDGNRTRIGFLDAAYRGVGGDRCVFGELQFGRESTPLNQVDLVSSLLSQSPDKHRERDIIALVDLVTIPLKTETLAFATADQVEDQITKFCMGQCAQRQIPPQNFFYDSGMRSSLVSSIARLWSPDTNPIDCGGIPTDQPVSADISIPCKDYYSKFITELWFSVRLIIEAGQFRGLSEECMMEGCSREWKMVGGNKVEVESKRDMKLKIGKSPDLFDALAIGVYGARKLGFRIDRLTDLRRVRQHESWKREMRQKAEEFWKKGSLNYAA